MPWIERSNHDGLAMIQYCRERVEELDCRNCDSSQWNPESTDKSLWPCRSPLLPAIRVNPSGKREVQYTQCGKYREWAEARKKRQGGDEPRRKAWKRRTY